MEGLSLLVKVLVTIILVRVYPEWGLISFCIAQVSGASESLAKRLYFLL